MIEAWRCSSFYGCGLVLWRLIPFAILWSVWKEKNDRVFKRSSSSVEDLTLLVVSRIAKWATFKSEFDSLRVDGVLHNWEAFLLCWARKLLLLKVCSSSMRMGQLGENRGRRVLVGCFTIVKALVGFVPEGCGLYGV